MNVGKEVLEREFIRKRETAESTEHELEQYYRQLEEIDAGNVTKTQRELVAESEPLRRAMVSAVLMKKST